MPLTVKEMIQIPIFNYGFASGHVWMWKLDYKENWALKNWYFWTVVLEKTLESPLDCKEIQPVHPKGDQSWVFIGRTDVEAKTPVLWPPDAKSWLIWKDPDAGKDWGQEEKGTTEDERVGWHHWLNGRGFRWTPGVGDGQGGLACFMELQRVGHDWATELNWYLTSIKYVLKIHIHNLYTYMHTCPHDNLLQFPEFKWAIAAFSFVTCLS